MKKILIFSLALICSACEISVNETHRSGTLDNDYIEEPAPQKYKQYLEATNYFIDAFATSQFSFIERNYLAPHTIRQLDEAKLKNLSVYVEASAGSYVSYPKGQWGFVPDKRDGMSLLHSIKIVEHEKATMHYIVTFLRDGKSSKVIDFTIKERKGVRHPGQLE